VRPRGITIALVVTCAVLLLSPLAPWAVFALSEKTPSGLRIHGRTLRPTEYPHRAIEKRGRGWLAAEVHVRAGDVERTRTRRELGAEVDIDRVARRAASYGRTGAPHRDLPDLFEAWSGGADLEWPIRIDYRATRAFVRELAQEIDHPPRPPIVDRQGRLVELSADGMRVRRADAVRAIASALRQNRRAFTIPVERISSGVGERALRPVLHPDAAPVVIGRYSTRYRMRGGEAARAHNVQTAASYLDGATIPARGRISFNDRVGARDRAHGYREAHVIIGGEMVDGIGGGVCQVASTLHAAAFLGGLDIVSHTPHSRPSEYIPMGLDATVVWPRIDLVIANPFSFPITVRAFTHDGELTVELYGRARVEVDWSHEVVATTPWSDRYVEDPLVRPGVERVSQRPIRGYTVVRERVIAGERGRRVESERIHYPPTDRIIRVAPGTLDPITQSPIEPSGPIEPI
jgi:vancomycin resistance protein YoaR